MNDGILCMSNAPIVCQKLNSIPNTSKENTTKKQENIIDNILGVQNINLSIFFFMRNLLSLTALLNVVDIHIYHPVFAI